MPLTTHVTDRLGTQRLIELTNPPAGGAAAQPSAIDAVRLARAATDAEALLQLRAGVAYDDANNLHIAVAVEAVVFQLMLRGGKNALEGLERVESRVNEQLDLLAQSTGRNRVLAASTSQLTASREDTTAGAVRPRFDPEHFERLMLRPPAGNADRSAEAD